MNNFVIESDLSLLLKWYFPDWNLHLPCQLPASLHFYNPGPIVDVVVDILFSSLVLNMVKLISLCVTKDALHWQLENYVD